MSAACPTCGQSVLTAARYCRACYTVFTSTPPAAPAARRNESRAWQLLLLLALAGGGWWAWSAETGTGERPEAWTDSAPADDASPDERRPGSESGNAARPVAADRPARFADAPRAPNPWLLQADSQRICGSPTGCEVTIRFGSGAAARFTVAPQAGSLSALVPLGEEGGRLLSRHSRGTLVGEGSRSLTIVTLGGRRWFAAGGPADGSES